MEKNEFDDLFETAWQKNRMDKWIAASKAMNCFYNLGPSNQYNACWCNHPAINDADPETATAVNWNREGMINISMCPLNKFKDILDEQAKDGDTPK